MMKIYGDEIDLSQFTPEQQAEIKAQIARRIKELRKDIARHKESALALKNDKRKKSRDPLPRAALIKCEHCGVTGGEHDIKCLNYGEEK